MTKEQAMQRFKQVVEHKKEMVERAKEYASVDILNYKGYIGSVEYSDGAIDDYLLLCEDKGIKPKKLELETVY